MARFMGLLFFLAIVSFLYWIAESGVIEESFRKGVERPEKFKLDLVRIKLYDEDARHYMTIIGDRAIVDKDFNSARIEEIRVVDKRTKPEGILSARLGYRKVIRNVEQLEFREDVFLRQGEEKSLKTEQLFFYPKEDLIEVPVSSTTKTTATTIKGDFLQTATSLEKGTIRGNVSINKTIVDDSGKELPVSITGDVCPFNVRDGVYRMKGNVSVLREGLKLTCHETRFSSRREIAWARGKVAVTDPEVIITCEELDYDVASDVVSISSKGSTKTTPSASRTTYRVEGDPSTWQLMELHAKEIEYRRAKGELEAKKDVLVVRWSFEDGALVRDFEISSDELQTVYQGDSKAPRPGAGRSNFSGNVRVESDDVGALGDRAVFYEDSRNFYVIGRAKAWSYDESGRRRNVITGGKILHDNRRGRNIVLEGVKGTFSEEEQR